MLTLRRTTSANADFQALVALLDADLRIRNGDTDDFYAQFNKPDSIKHVVVAYHAAVPVGCGAFKEFSDWQVEIKRMYVLPTLRGQGIAQRVLMELERWATEIGYDGCVLETGLRNPEALQLYEKNGYARIANYGQYAGVATSVCMGKTID